MARKPTRKKASSRGTKAAATKPRITLAMIARNESKFLDACLDSVEGVVDEIVVVDTGSEDDTAAIAKRHGARVIDFEWCDDFAAARNCSLQHSTGDWVLILDADEQLDPKTKRFIRKAAADPEADFCYLRLVNMSKVGPVGPEIRSMRLLRRLDGLRYQGRIHEQPLLQRVKPGVQCEALVRHYGYDPEVFQAKDKKNRNTRLIELGLAETEAGANPKLRTMYLFYHALQAEHDERFRRLERFARCVQSHSGPIQGRLPWIPCGMIHYGIELRNRDRIDDLAATACWTIEQYGEAPVLRALLGHALLRQGKIGESQSEVTRALAGGVDKAGIHQEYSLPGNLAAVLAGVIQAEIHERQGKWAAAEEYYRGLAPDLPEVGPRYAYVLSRLDKSEQALQVLEFSLAAQQEVRADQACLAFVLSLTVQSTRGLIAWGEHVRAMAAENGTCRKVLDRVEERENGAPFRVEDFPEIEEMMGFR